MLWRATLAQIRQLDDLTFYDKANVIQNLNSVGIFKFCHSYLKIFLRFMQEVNMKHAFSCQLGLHSSLYTTTIKSFHK